MVLKRIELNGFKSFADKTEILLSPGLTVVVGPNGSGKSNVADAIRWVLGEQSPRSLRGSKMEDVIFAGSDRRKPVGMAEVSLTLDNEKGMLPVDYREVTVTRRVFRSGESDYLLNRSPCRLRDLQELFSDTGLGREGISIIGQGRVDEVLSSRPEERRALIEEAAGIVRYRNRKREAVKKLEETEQHLIRLGDIIGELQQQLAAISSQAELARRYQTLEVERKEVELGLLVVDWEEMTATMEKTRRELDRFSALLWEKEAQLATLEGAEADAALAARQVEEALTATRQEAHRRTEGVIALQGRLNVVRERIKGLAAQLQLLTKEQEQSRLALAELRNREGEQRERRRLVAEELMASQQAVDARLLRNAAAREAVTAVEKEIADLRRRLFDSAQALARLRTQLHEADLRVARQEAQVRRLEGERERSRSRASELVGEADRLRREAAARERQRADKQAERDADAAEMAQWRGQFNELEHRLSQTMRRWQEVSARRKAIEAMEKTYEGFASGVREVLAQVKAGNPQLQGIIGVFSDLIEVPPGLETAIDVALGGGMQNIVAEDDQAARGAIEHLKRTRKGRATFLPLKSLQVYGGPGRDVLNQPGVIGCAADLVRSATAHMPAVRFLLGRTLVMENLPGALQFARQTRYQWRIVTLEGDLLQPGGSVTGGSQGQRGGQTFLRRRELALLAEEEQTLGLAISDLKQQREEAAEQIGRLEGRIQAQERSIAHLDAEKAANAADLARLQREMEQEARQISGIEGELAILQDDLASLMAEKARLQDEMVAAETEAENLETAMSERQGELERLRAAGEDDREDLTRWQLALARQEEEIRGIDQSLAALHTEIGKSEKEIGEKEERCRMANGEMVACAEEQIYMEKELAAAVAEEACALEQVRLRQEEQAEADRGYKETMERRKAVAAEVQPLREKVHQLEVQLARLDAEKDTLTQRLAEQWDLSPEQARERGRRPEDRRAAQKRLNQLRALQKDMGPVNLLAIEEEERLQERAQFLSRQHEDLMAAKGTLEQVIAEIEGIMVRRFSQAFEEINSRFGEVFADLFQGGRAELVLTAPGDLLTTGVDILAQPPGKKLVNLSLLSGGERALTAIALLFALLQFRPSPFCVLDEIEAALDEANVARFGRYLQRLSEKSQFIVISHRKGTMESADYLYGVTMQEAGVSKLISVRMTRPDENSA
ncbi:chromosome partition protein smc, putative [Heliomicrobium modesticaldum Ice1]|uniref:Chromosome partition protein Smc n=1 Tax=Heliobacterium modesticaldum (strain ATCC 51547 / Ice1) TaxID=498761 RepID=B0TGW8_HELMI|nr:chromosome segregation protein SMC [Heliomicrobium modesticaldum]ABZ84729.1 chromosome partition protein smc, putative [Heliomicrobium modesticaldum Ice1]